MPNYCDNKLTVVGTNSMLQDFIQIASSSNSVLSFNNFLPMPEEESKNCCDWNIENWGTKWDAVDCHMNSVSEYQMDYYFRTAWVPPWKWYPEVVEQFPELSFILKYEEWQRGLAGRWVEVRGKHDKENSFTVETLDYLPMVLEQYYWAS
jgi:hypothetical protein